MSTQLVPADVSMEILEAFECMGINAIPTEINQVERQDPIVVVIQSVTRPANIVEYFQPLLESHKARIVIALMNGGEEKTDFATLLRNVSLPASYVTVDIFLTNGNLERWPFNLFHTRRNANAFYRIKQYLDKDGARSRTNIPLSTFINMVYNDVIRKTSDMSRPRKMWWKAKLTGCILGAGICIYILWDRLRFKQYKS